jgi:hypothetical protein
MAGGAATTKDRPGGSWGPMPVTRRPASAAMSAPAE